MKILALILGLFAWSVSAEDDRGRTNAAPGWNLLFNGRDLQGWHTFLQEHGRDQDPAGIITIKDGMIHLYKNTPDGSRVVMGYIATEKEWGDYHLRLEYKWGTKKFEPRLTLPLDAGLYYHIVGEDAIWPKGLQYQIEKGSVADLIALYGAQVDSWIDPATAAADMKTFLDPKEGGQPVVLGGKGLAYQKRRGDLERDGWNTVDLIVRGTSATHLLNGKLVNRFENIRFVSPDDPSKSTPLSRGRIALEIEAAEIFYRNVEIKSLSDEPASGLRVGAAAVDFAGDDAMVIAGGIHAGKAAGQEGKLRAVAVVLEKKPFPKLAIVACDLLMITREHLDPVVAEIEKTTGIPAANILINCTHTHHAPSTMKIHDYGLDGAFTKQVQARIVQAVQAANGNLSTEDCRFLFHLGEEKTVGQNSRRLLDDGQIYWIGPRTNIVRDTGPFDPELPVLAFRDSSDKLRALIFNHSTHTIGARTPGKRSPGFYGLAAQDMEAELGGAVCFLEGASGSTHNLGLSGEECAQRIKRAALDALGKAQPRAVDKIAAIKRPFKYRVRQFDEAHEEAAVAAYCRKYASGAADPIMKVFRNMRQDLASQRGQERETWIQVLRIGDVALVGVPAEYFTQLGIDIKNRSPFRHTYVAELANDWIGYLPNLEGHKLGGYQTWTGYHSYAEPGTGERMADEVVAMLKELAK